MNAIITKFTWDEEKKQSVSVSVNARGEKAELPKRQRTPAASHITRLVRNGKDVNEVLGKQ
jgi:hypothetical protein